MGKTGTHKLKNEKKKRSSLKISKKRQTGGLFSSSTYANLTNPDQKEIRQKFFGELIKLIQNGTLEQIEQQLIQDFLKSRWTREDRHSLNDIMNNIVIPFFFQPFDITGIPSKYQIFTTDITAVSGLHVAILYNRMDVIRRLMQREKMIRGGDSDIHPPPPPTRPAPSPPSTDPIVKNSELSAPSFHEKVIKYATTIDGSFKYKSDIGETTEGYVKPIDLVFTWGYFGQNLNLLNTPQRPDLQKLIQIKDLFHSLNPSYYCNNSDKKFEKYQSIHTQHTDLPKIELKSDGCIDFVSSESVSSESVSGTLANPVKINEGNNFYVEFKGNTYQIQMITPISDLKQTEETAQPDSTDIVNKNRRAVIEQLNQKNANLTN